MPKSQLKSMPGSKLLVYWHLSAVPRRGKPHTMTVVVRFARQAGIVALFVAAALGGTLSGVLFAYSDDLPEVSALDNYTPNTITRVRRRQWRFASGWKQRDEAK